MQHRVERLPRRRPEGLPGVVRGRQHARRVEAVRAAIAEGETYQCNLTTRLRSTFCGDAFGLYGELAHRQRGGHHAFLDLGRHTVVSASPESFLHWEDGLLRTAPMKGTAARGRTPEADAAGREALLASEKDRAENVMITDLVRNDLQTVCRPGTVAVTSLLEVEEHPGLARERDEFVEYQAGFADADADTAGEGVAR